MESNTKQRLERIRRAVDAEARALGVTIQRVLLFGSRARAEAREDSDWDLLVITDQELDRPLRLNLERVITVRLARERLPADVLVMSADQFEMRKGDIGHIAYYVNREYLAL